MRDHVDRSANYARMVGSPLASLNQGKKATSSKKAHAHTHKDCLARQRLPPKQLARLEATLFMDGPMGPEHDSNFGSVALIHIDINKSLFEGEMRKRLDGLMFPPIQRAHETNLTENHRARAALPRYRACLALAWRSALFSWS